VRDATVSETCPFTLPGAFVVHRFAETIKDSSQQVPADRYRALSARGYDTTAGPETSGVPQRHARDMSVSDGYHLGSKVHAFDPDFLTNRRVDASHVKP
jgi:hypothetical protein